MEPRAFVELKGDAQVESRDSRGELVLVVAALGAEKGAHGTLMGKCIMAKGAWRPLEKNITWPCTEGVRTNSLDHSFEVDLTERLKNRRKG
jgi:hypothetical protein